MRQNSLRAANTPDIVRDRNSRYVWHLWSSLNANLPQLTFLRGKGYRIWDVDGKEYIDASSINLTCGYANLEIAKAIEDQILKLHYSDLSKMSHESVGLLAEYLANILPKDLSKTLFVNSGSEGIEAAIFIANCYWAQIGSSRSRELFRLLAAITEVLL